MKLTQMRAFREIMLTGSVSEAARNLHRSQPAVSAMVSGLEDSLGIRLFERKGGRLHPVPEAQYLFDECNEVLGRIENLQQNMREIRGLNTGRLEIVSMPGPSVFFLPNLISDFLAGKPDTESELISRSSEMVLQLVAAQQYDLGIADYFEAKIEDSSLMRAEVFRFNCLCAMRREDPLAQYALITPKELDGKALATLYPGHEHHSNVTRVFAESGNALRIRFTTRYFIPLLTYVEKNLAYGLVDPIAVASYHLYRGEDGPIVFRPFCPEVHYTSAVLMPTYRPASLLTQAFTQQVLEIMEKLANGEGYDFKASADL